MNGVGAQRGYRGPAGLVEAVSRIVAVAAGGLCLSACSLALPIGPKAEDTTQSVSPRIVSTLSPDLAEEDWRRAKGALAVALDPQGSGGKVSWDNPDTTARGSFTPVGQPFVNSDEICRAFVATLSGQASASTLQGTACRPSGGMWSIRDVRPFKAA